MARQVSATLDLSDDPELERAVKAFVAQESSHGHQHVRYNEVLEARDSRTLPTTTYAGCQESPGAPRRR